MKYTEAKWGRVFVLRLEDGDRIPEVFENFALEHNLSAAVVHFLGGTEHESRIVVGPEDGTTARPVPMVITLNGVSEAVGMGTIFRNAEGKPKLHMHAAFGRGEDVKAGCTRAGVGIWKIGEAVVVELLLTGAGRKVHPENGFELLEIE